MSLDFASLPPMIRLRQHFPRPQVADVPQTVSDAVAALIEKDVMPGDRVALGVGSRGIARIGDMAAAATAAIRRAGATPVIIPAMGSHGGATAAGQTRQLSSLGVTAESCGCEIDARMDAPPIAESSLGAPIHFALAAREADHVLLLNRIKPHTRFTGPLASGLCKMLIVGLGKHPGPQTLHPLASRLGFERVVTTIVQELLPHVSLLGGVAVIENAYEEIAAIEAVPAEELLVREPPLLEQAVALMPRLPAEEIDVLLIDRIGKDISGSGLDTNIVGRKFNDNQPTDAERPAVHRIVARSLTPASHGNAIGMGLCEFITPRLASSIDFQASLVNGMASCHIGAVKQPPVMPSDRAALLAAVESLGIADPAEARIMHIHSTLELAELACSPALLEEALSFEGVEAVSEPASWPFDAGGNLP